MKNTNRIIITFGGMLTIAAIVLAAGSGQPFHITGKFIIACLAGAIVGTIVAHFIYRLARTT